MLCCICGEKKSTQLIEYVTTHLLTHIHNPLYTTTNSTVTGAQTFCTNNTFISQLPPPLKWRSDICPCFLSGSVQFFVFTLLFFFSLLISSLRCGQWWGIFQLCCCCLFAAGKSRHCLCTGEGGANSIGTRVIDTSQTLTLALIGCI